MKKFIVLLFSICLLTYTPVFAITFPEIHLDILEHLQI